LQYVACILVVFWSFLLLSEHKNYYDTDVLAWVYRRHESGSWINPNVTLILVENKILMTLSSVRERWCLSMHKFRVDANFTDCPLKYKKMSLCDILGLLFLSIPCTTMIKQGPNVSWHLQVDYPRLDIACKLE